MVKQPRVFIPSRLSGLIAEIKRLPSQTPQQKLNSLYAELGLNLRDNDSTSDEMQRAAMALAVRARKLGMD